MDGNTIDLDPRTAEAMRQEKVYQNAMASLGLQNRQADALEDTLMAPGYALSNVANPDSKLARTMGWTKFLLVALGGGIINYLFYATVLNG